MSYEVQCKPHFMFLWKAVDFNSKLREKNVTWR